jgi:hypothetical protein
MTNHQKMYTTKQFNHHQIKLKNNLPNQFKNHQIEWLHHQTQVQFQKKTII